MNFIQYIDHSAFRRNRVLWHILFWVWLYALDVFIFGVGYHNIELFLKFALLEMPGQLFFAYAVMYWLVPRYSSRLASVESMVWLFVLFVITGVIGHILFIETSSYPEPASFLDIPKIFLRSFYSFLKACIFIVLKLTMMWYQNHQKVMEMEKTKTESELKMLKEQVNPHFMFNTLNNLYGLIGKNPMHAQESVLGLSAILRYMLYETNYPFVSLHREIRCIQDYIELEKLRYAGTLSVSINVDPQVGNLAIVPLTIFPFVENSFKHGASELVRDAWINIDLSIHKGQFVFKIENSKRTDRHRHTHANGIGLANVKRRLELVYGNHHKLTIHDTAEQYLVILKIEMDQMRKETERIHEDEMSYR